MRGGASSLGNGVGPFARPPGDRGEHLTPEQIRILIVDDDRVDRQFARKSLQDEWTITVDEAATAQEALQHAAQADHDLVLLDHLLPDMDGLEVLPQLRERTGAPVIVLTGHGDEELAVQAIKQGASDYLSKDRLTSQRLLMTSRNVLRTHQLARRVNAMGQEVHDLQAVVSNQERAALVGVLSENALDGVYGGIDHVVDNLRRLQTDLDEQARSAPEDRDFLLQVSGEMDQLLAHPLQQIEGLIDLLSMLHGLLLQDPSPEPTDLDEVVRQTVHRYRSVAGRDLAIETDLGVMGPVDVDPRTVREVLTRLLKNAAEASPDGGRVRVRTRAEDTAVVVSVEDEGDGVPEDVGQRAFDLFATTKQGHDGIGLTIVKHLVNNHGGTVSFEHRSGGGARFSFRLPAGPREGGGTRART